MPLNSMHYYNFLARALPELMEDVPLPTRQRMWFQHDGTPAHFSRPVRRFLNRQFAEKWIGRGGPIPWPARSPDMTPMDFFVWGEMRNLVYTTPVESEEDLVARIVAEAGAINDTPGVFARVRQKMIRQSQLCLNVNGGIFESLL